MSKPFLHRTVDVAVSGLDSGLLFSEADELVQADFLRGLLYAVTDWSATQSWPQQCRSIAECLSQGERRGVSLLLGSLIEHLDEVPTIRQSV